MIEPITGSVAGCRAPEPAGKARTIDAVPGQRGKEWRELTREELNNEAQAGLKGQGAVTETMFRLQQSIDQASGANDTTARQMWWLTVVIGFLTLVQAVAAIVQVIAIIKPTFFPKGLP